MTRQEAIDIALQCEWGMVQNPTQDNITWILSQKDYEKLLHRITGSQVDIDPDLIFTCDLRID